MTPGGRTDVLTWIALLVLLAITCGSSFIPMGPMNTVVNLAVAAIKALLVVLVFMRLSRERLVIRLVASAGIVWLAFLVGLSGKRPPSKSALKASSLSCRAIAKLHGLLLARLIWII